ncbi:hypothetical protein [Helicobacter sp. 11S03491-1]|uniref:hypothetical protein n=1 Tax=Helicobacter sp. 11S03491-1 TaxID=1476196 RepID=UPI000BA60B50|nr:hypothetical protein [Helicobacter sp. 11S03491-1]PAF43885.1 hypothetical protein BKH45_01070 [Helicobacter sp. 11S03491-1]
MKKILFFSVMAAVFLNASNLPVSHQTPKFPRHIEKCIDGYLYRAFINDHNEVIPGSVSQIMERGSLHEKVLPKTCKENKENSDSK